MIYDREYFEGEKLRMQQFPKPKTLFDFSCIIDNFLPIWSRTKDEDVKREAQAIIDEARTGKAKHRAKLDARNYKAWNCEAKPTPCSEEYCSQKGRCNKA